MSKNVTNFAEDRTRNHGIRAKPSFLFIGPARVGSNWFTEILREHPGIFIPPNRGTFFFSYHHHLGSDWYESFFTGAGPRIAGEICENYLPNAEAMRRIRTYDPHLRLICCLRNPYERSISEWRFYDRNGSGEATLAAQAVRNPTVFESSLYATHLRLARSLFDRDQILIFLFEELAADPQSVARTLYEFIGVDPDFVAPSLNRRVNGNARPRSRSLARIIHDIHIRSWGPSRTASNVVGKLKSIRPLRRLLQTLLYDQGAPVTQWSELISEFPLDVIARYEHEITVLEEILAKNLSSWRLPASAQRLKSALPGRSVRRAIR